MDPKTLNPGDRVIFGGKVIKKVTKTFSPTDSGGPWVIQLGGSSEFQLSVYDSLWEIAEIKKETWELAWDEIGGPPSVSMKENFKRVWEKYQRKDIE